jgi:hypothetical protein
MSHGDMSLRDILDDFIMIVKPIKNDGDRSSVILASEVEYFAPLSTRGEGLGVR